MPKQKTLYAVSGRVHGDDDDTVILVAAVTSDKAYAKFERQMRKERGIKKSSKSYTDIIYSNSALSVGTVLPDGLLKLNGATIHGL